jgi:hypothetical protein
VRLASGRVRLRFRDRERVPDLDRPTVPPPIGRRGSDPADICIPIDDSGSTGGTDPNGYRYTAGRRIMNLLVEGIGGDRLDDRIAVVHFADQPTPWLPLTGLRSKGERARIRQVLQPLTGGGTQIVPAIERAGKLFGRSTDGRLKVCLLFTDGESGETAEQLRRAVEKLPTGSVHVVVLGDQLPDQWHDVPVGSVTALPELHTADDVEWVLARALYRSLSLEWRGPAFPPS